jgi:hypothetical protein
MLTSNVSCCKNFGQKCLPFPELLQGLVELRPVPSAAEGLLLENSFTAGVLQHFNLGGVVLAMGFGHASVAEKQGTFFHWRLISHHALASTRDCAEAIGLACSSKMFQIRGRGNGSGLNSNKGTKSDMEVCPSPYSPRDYAYVASPNYRHHSSSQFWELDPLNSAGCRRKYVATNHRGVGDYLQERLYRP